MVPLPAVDWNLSVLNVGGVVNVSIFNGQGTNMYFRQLIAISALTLKKHDMIKLNTAC